MKKHEIENLVLSNDKNAIVSRLEELEKALAMCEIALRYVNFDGELNNEFAVPAAQKAAKEALSK